MKRMFMLIGLSTLFLLTRCGREKQEEAETKFSATRPLKKDTLITREYVCQIHAIQHIELRALERGYLQNIFVDEGQHIRKGQRMFQIMPMLYEAEQQRAKAEANFAEIEYQNTKSLADSNVVSKNELALAKAKFDKANAELSLATVHLGFTQINAPFDGIMDRFQVRLGSLIEEGELLSTLSDNSKMWVYFNVPEAEYLDYKAHAKKDSIMHVNLIMANNQRFQYPGLVEAIEADFNNETGNIAFRATFPNPKSLLRHGETGNIEMIVPLRNVLLVPQKATFEVLEKKYVFVLDKDKVIHQREITIGAEMPDLYVVTAGISADDMIILEGIRKVKDNEKIAEFEYEDPKEVIAHLKVYVE
jgi:membrane fusion protein, multidrug efflux system